MVFINCLDKSQILFKNNKTSSSLSFEISIVTNLHEKYFSLLWTGANRESQSWSKCHGGVIGPNWNSSITPSKAQQTLRKRSSKNVRTGGWSDMDVFWIWHCHRLLELTHCIWNYFHKFEPVKISSQEKDVIMLFSHWKFLTFFDCISVNSSDLLT